MSEKVTINWSAVKSIEAKADKALVATADILRDDMRQAMVIPRDTGNLQNESFYTDSSQASKGLVRLVHNAPYARRLYFHPEYNFRKDKNPNAQGLWFRPWMKLGAKEKRAQEIFEACLKKVL